MKFNYKKVATIMGSALMLGATVGMAAAASFTPSSFTDGGIALVVGRNAATSDMGAALALTTNLGTLTDSSGSVTAGDVKVVDDEVALGGLITGGDIATTLKDNKLSGLADSKFTWDDGISSDEFNYHEEIVIGVSNVTTTTDDKKFDGVALTNDNALNYRFVFDEAINTTGVGNANADTLYLTIMGQQYEIEAMTADSITVTTSEEVSMSIGEEITVNGKQVKLVDVFSADVEVQVDGVTKVIGLADTERVSGIRVHVESIGYHSNTPETSKAVLKVGADISKTFTDGDEYIGQDEDDPLWVWDIVTTNVSGGYVGVKYNAKIDSANDKIAGDTIKYVGSGYVFPNDYVAVTLDSITAANYEDLKIYFEDSEDLFDNATGSTALIENAKVLVIEAENSDTITVNSLETDKIFVYFNTTTDKFQTFYNDLDGDYTPTGKMRLADSVATAAVTGNATTGGSLTADSIATIEIGDTNLEAYLKVVANVTSLVIYNTEAGFTSVPVVNLTLGGAAVNTNTTGTLERFGVTVEDAETADVIFNGTDVSTEDYDYMDHYGIKLSDGTTVNAEADDDMVTLSIPDEQVFAQVTVSMGASVSGSDSGVMTVYDDEMSLASGKNLIVIGGSAVNTVAAELLSGATGGDSFTAATGVKAGEAIIKSFTRSGKTALLVAGFNAEDTTRAVTYLSNNVIDTTVGKALKVTSATTATAITA